jgi:hypothetical protein
VSATDARQTILAWLDALPEAPWAVGPPAGGGSHDLLHPIGQPFAAKLATVQFHKQRAISGRQVHALTFEDHDGRSWHWIDQVIQNEAGSWWIMGGSGWSGAPTVRPRPWANLAGGGWPHRFFAGGSVLDADAGVVRVRLQSAGGLVLEDTVDDGLVLFITDQALHVPATVELYDRAGALVGRHRWP